MQKEDAGYLASAEGDRSSRGKEEDAHSHGVKARSIASINLKANGRFLKSGHGLIRCEHLGG